MKTYYYVEQKVFDSGKATTRIGKLDAEQKPDDVNKEQVKYDLYRNYFDTEDEANHFYKENH